MQTNVGYMNLSSIFLQNFNLKQPNNLISTAYAADNKYYLIRKK